MRSTFASVGFAALIASALGIGVTPAAAATCEGLAGLVLPDTTITIAQQVLVRPYTAPDGAVFTNLPAFCRVAATLTPTSDSNIKIEVWMPSAGWNGRFLGTGNGSIGGVFQYGALGFFLTLNYAVANTDLGHVAGGDRSTSWPRADRPSREADRLCYPIDQSDDRAFQTNHQSLLR